MSPKLTGFIKLYRNNLEVSCVPFNGKRDREKIVQCWMHEIKNIINENYYAIGIELNI